MKIAFYAPLKSPRHPVPSGDRSVALDLWERFRARGHECLLLSEFRSPWFYRSASGVLSACGHLAAAAARAGRFRPDLFFTYHMYHKAPDPIGPALSRLLRRPYALFEAVYSEAPRRNPATAAGYHLARWAIRRAGHVFSNTLDDLPDLRRLVPPERLTYVAPSVDPVLFSPDPGTRAAWRRRHGVGEDELLVACAAMLRPDRKAAGVGFLIETLGDLRRSGLRPRFVLAGGGECFAGLRETASRTLGGASLLLGCVPRQEVARLMAAADVFAFPGIDEGFGFVYMEAQACAVPVVAFRNGSIPDVVEDGVGGLLTPPMDRRAYGAALARLLRDDGLRRRLGEAGRRRMLERHHPQTNYDRVVSRCEALVRRPAQAGTGRAG